jgi:hypothetical protein
MDTDIIKDRLKEQIAEGVAIVDDGIGYFECGSVTGVDKQIGLESESGDLELDITDFLDEGETPESIMAEGLTLTIDVSKSKGGDPDACAESGRRHCGSCDACGTVDASFTAKLEKVEKKDDKVIASFEIGD